MIRRVSEYQKRRLADYARAKIEWNKVERRCEYPGCYRVAEKQPHHKFGRGGKLLCAVETWIGLCFSHHRYVHDNIEESRKMGLMCEKGKWNNYGLEPKRAG